MATIADNLNLQIAHFSAFKNYIPKINKMDITTVDTLLKTGLIEVSTAFEHAIAHLSGTKVISQNHADLSCGSDAKLSTVRNCSYGRAYSAPVTGIHNKTGDLLVQVYERKQNKFYYFRIPYHSYSHIPKSSNIEIPFTLDGNPRRSNKWWAYEVDTFEQMCLNVAPVPAHIKIINNLFEEAA